MPFLVWVIVFAVFIIFAALKVAMDWIVMVARVHGEREKASLAARAWSWSLLVVTVLGGTVLYANEIPAAVAPLALGVGALMQLLATVNSPVRVNEKMLSPRDRDQFESLGWSLVIVGSAAAVLLVLPWGS